MVLDVKIISSNTHYIISFPINIDNYLLCLVPILKPEWKEVLRISIKIKYTVTNQFKTEFRAELCYRFWNWLEMQQETTRRTGSSQGTCCWLWGTTRNLESFLLVWRSLTVGCFRTSTQFFFQRNLRRRQQQRSPSPPPKALSPLRRPNFSYAPPTSFCT